MTIKELRELIAYLPDHALVLQETGDHEMHEPIIGLSDVYYDPGYGLIEAYMPLENSTPALIIR